MPQQNNLQSTSQEQSSQQNNKLMLIINKLNKDTTMTTMAYIELPAEQKAHEQWIKDQVEWNKQNETRKQKLQDEYFNLSDKMYEDRVSKAEYNSMENVKMKY